MEAYVIGYDDNLFQHPVGQSLHCCICTNVFRDPVMCRRNEHIFCRACITRYLTDSQRCPSCVELLTVDTFNQVPQAVMNLLSELKIRCNFFDRGCGTFTELASLESHVRECGFAPVYCSNEGCQLEVNKRDLMHHETTVCEQRRVKCHSCDDTRQDMEIVKVNLAAINVKLNKIETNLKAVEENVVNVVTKVELVEKHLIKQKVQLNNQEESNRQQEADNVEMKKSLNELTRQMEIVAQHMPCPVQDEQEKMKKRAVAAVQIERQPKVIVAGGWNGESMNSVEMFNLSNGTWTPLQPMKECRRSAWSVVYNNEMIVMGGVWSKSMEQLSLHAVHVDQSICWKIVPSELPKQLWGHCSVVYNGRLLVIGGDDGKTSKKVIIEIARVPPYTTKLLATMPQKGYYHGVVLFGDKILILGGRQSSANRSTLQTVWLYDITKNTFEELAPLPYPVVGMATVKWGEDNVIIMGGIDSEGNRLSKVLMYNVKTQNSYMLPDMKYERAGCVAAVVRETVIVMGGQDENRDALKSVECFRFDRYTWEDLPEMHQRRCSSIAIVC